MKAKRRIFSGIQPSGGLTIGNYLGAIKNWLKLQEEYDCLYCIVDLHALTVRQDPKELRQRTLSLAALYIASGLDPDKNTLFIQSSVSAHAELAWILNCYTYVGELGRMTQYKEKTQKHSDNINSGLFTYPILMAADILLYETDLVPVGEDQKQHLELSRDIAMRFNSIYGNIFTVPEVYIPKAASKVMDLQNPLKKMSKSDDDVNSYVLLLDSPDLIMKKFKRAVTDSESRVEYDKERKPGIANLIEIYSAITGRTFEAIELEFENKGYGAFKTAVGESVVETLKPLQAKYEEIMNDKGCLEKLMLEGSQKAKDISAITLRNVYERLGLYYNS